MCKLGFGMVEFVKKDFFEIDFVKFVMIGDIVFDMEFGWVFGMWIVFIEIENEFISLVDFVVENLLVVI